MTTISGLAAGRAAGLAAVGSLPDSRLSQHQCQRACEPDRAHLRVPVAATIAAFPRTGSRASSSHCDRSDGDIDTLSNRIAHVRTWTFVANRTDWLEAPLFWQSRTREIEDKLSDALHERLTQRFIDRRTSVLMRRLAQKEELMSTVEEDGALHVEGEYVGRIKGFHFIPDGARRCHGQDGEGRLSQGGGIGDPGARPDGRRLPDPDLTLDAARSDRLAECADRRA